MKTMVVDVGIVVERTAWWRGTLCVAVSQVPELSCWRGCTARTKSATAHSTRMSD